MAESVRDRMGRTLGLGQAEAMARQYQGLAGGDLRVALRMLATDRCAELASTRRRRAPVAQDDARG